MPHFTAGQKVRASDLNSRPVGHMGVTGSFQNQVKGASGGYLNLTPQLLKYGMVAASNSALKVPEDGTYRLTAKMYFRGPETGLCEGEFSVNSTTAPAPPGTSPVGRFVTNKPNGDDFSHSFTALANLSANDEVRLWCKSTCASWGTVGYDGAFMEVEWVCA